MSHFGLSRESEPPLLTLDSGDAVLLDIVSTFFPFVEDSRNMHSKPVSSLLIMAERE